MDNRIKADSNQEIKTVPTGVPLTFVSGKVERDLLSVLDSKGLKRGHIGLEVTVVENDGRIEGRIKP